MRLKVIKSIRINNDSREVVDADDGDGDGMRVLIDKWGGILLENEWKVVFET